MVIGDVKERINEILCSNTVEQNVDFLIEWIPEIKSMIGFDQKHPHHHLDVWNHTLMVLSFLTKEDLELKMAALLHDIGKPFCFQNGLDKYLDIWVRHYHGHADYSADRSKKILNRLGYDEDFVTNVCYLVKYHDTIIEPIDIEFNRELNIKRLKLQYADAKSHSPHTIERRLARLDEVAADLKIKCYT